MRVEDQFSAGGVVFRGHEVLLISTNGGRRWQLPKGHIEPDESLEETAVREVREETGVTGRLITALPEVEFWFTERGVHRVHKRVSYFLLQYVEGDCADFDPKEVFGAAWLGWDEALARLSFANERRVLERARKLAAAATAPDASGSPAGSTN